MTIQLTQDGAVLEHQDSLLPLPGVLEVVEAHWFVDWPDLGALRVYWSIALEGLRGCSVAIGLSSPSQRKLVWSSIALAEVLAPNNSQRHFLRRIISFVSTCFTSSTSDELVLVLQAGLNLLVGGYLLLIFLINNLDLLVDVSNIFK